MNPSDGLIDTLPPLSRFALVYAPRDAWLPTLALLALDARLASVVREAREPLLAQMRLAWWHERLCQSPDERPSGEPLLAALDSWDGESGALAALVDGWEAMIDPPPLPGPDLDRLATARGQSFATLSLVLDCGQARDQALRMGRDWALADLANGLSHPEEIAAVSLLIQRVDWTARPLPRRLRPLGVLHALAARSVRLGVPMRALSAGALMTGIRAGLLGR